MKAKKPSAGAKSDEVRLADDHPLVPYLSTMRLPLWPYERADFESVADPGSQPKGRGRPRGPRTQAQRMIERRSVLMPKTIIEREKVERARRHQAAAVKGKQRIASENVRWIDATAKQLLADGVTKVRNLTTQVSQRAQREGRPADRSHLMEVLRRLGHLPPR